MKKRKMTTGSTRHQPDSVVSSPPARGRLRLWILVALLLVLIAAVWISGSLARVPRHFAQRSLTTRDFASAWHWTNVAGWLSYHDPASALLAARIARCEGNAERLQQELMRARLWGADPQALHREEVLALAQSGQLEEIEPEVIAWLAQSDAEADEISDAYANGLSMIARFEDAVTVLGSWREDFPDDPRPEYRLARIEEHQEQYAQAEASYRRALAKNADFLPARYGLGRNLLHERRAEEAVDVFRSCLDIPHPEAVQVELAVALKTLGRADEARPLLQKALAADPSRLSASYVALDERPEGFKAAAEYGKLEADAGNFAEAERWLTKALDANPLDLIARYALAVSLRGLGKEAEANREFDRVAAGRAALDSAGALHSRIKARPEDLEARYLLGKVILKNESERTGLYWLRSIFTYDPGYAPAHELLADHYAAKSAQESYFARLADYHRKMAAASRNKAAPP